MQKLARTPNKTIQQRRSPLRSSLVETLESRQFLAASLGGGIAIGGTTPVGTPAASVLPAYADKIGISGAVNPTPTFDDEFDGTALDLSKWQVRNGTRYRVEPNSPEWTVTSPHSVKVGNGELSLIAHNDPVTGQYESGWIQTSTNNGGDTSNLVPGSSANFLQAYGYWEAKLKMSSVSGMWNAFWVHAPQMPDVGDDPAKANHPEIYGTEMDVVEQSAYRIDNASGNTVHTTTHANGYASQHISSSAHTNVATLPTASGVDQYHIYGLLWTPQSVSVYMDGTLAYTETNPILVSKAAHMAILSNEIGAPGSKVLGQGHLSWGAVPAGGYGSVDTSPARLTADYVRVWSLTGSIPVPTPVPTPSPSPSPTPAPGSGTLAPARPRPTTTRPPAGTINIPSIGGTGVVSVGLTTKIDRPVAFI